jgi:hypothetical protein
LGYDWYDSIFDGRIIVARKTHRGFDFDHWAALARDDPARFEELRRDRVDELIQQSSPRQRQRLRGIQFRIDMERRRSASPMGACVRIQSLMWDSVLGPDGFYERLLVFSGRRAATVARPDKAASPSTSSLSPASSRSPPCATIIPFPVAKKPSQE